MYFYQVDELWDSMCHTAVGLISDALHEVDNAESLLKIKNLIVLFMQAMDVCQSRQLTLEKSEWLTIYHRLGIFPSVILKTFF
jgi:hypothetical protein